MPVPRGARPGFIGIPGSRGRRQAQSAYGDVDGGDLGARYAEAVRRHDEALMELRQVSDDMAEAVRRQAAEPTPRVAREVRIADEPEPAEAAPACDDPGPQAGKRRGRRRDAAGADGPRDPDRPANLRYEQNPETGSMCLSWDAVPRDGLSFGVWRSVTPREGPAGVFERLCTVRETGYIDTTAPADALRISYAVRALVGRRPVPGSTHICVALGAA
jgi:hypothetical protein